MRTPFYRLVAEAELVEGEADGLAEIEPIGGEGIGIAGGAGGAVARETVVFHHAAGAEEMVVVADENAGFPAEAFEDFRAGGDGLGGGCAFAFDVDAFNGDAFVGEVAAADFGFGVDGVAAGAAGGEKVGGELAAVEIEGVVEAGAEDGGGFAAVFGGTEDDDDVDGLIQFRPGGLRFDRQCEMTDLPGPGQGKDAADNQNQPTHEFPSSYRI